MSEKLVKNKKSSRKLPITITEEEVISMVKATEDPKLRLAVMLGFYQCLRISEVLKLQPKDVDRDRGFLHILNAKGGKDRDVSIVLPIKKGLKHLPVGYTYRTLLRKVQRLAKETIGKHIRFHWLRHGGATFYLNNNVDVRMIQARLGHSRLDTTMIYTHVTPDSQKKAFDKVWEED